MSVNHIYVSTFEDSPGYMADAIPGLGTVRTDGYTSGLAAEPRAQLPGYDSTVLGGVLAMLLLVVFSLDSFSRLMRRISNGLWNVRARLNAFDEHTIAETRTTVALNLQACICSAIILYTAAADTGVAVPGHMIPAAIGLLTLLTAIYTGSQWTVYSLIGYVFTSRAYTSQWIQGFSAIQSVLSLALLLPALILLFYPEAGNVIIPLCAMIYVLLRIVFIVKGFRIFFHNYLSLVYFILYLCSVEIIPAILIYNGALSICRIIIS